LAVHLGILVLLVVMVAIVGALVALVVFFALSRKPPMVRAPTISADGKWWWDGSEWKPVSGPPTTSSGS